MDSLTFDSTYLSTQYHRIYSPISFGKKYDPNGDYIRHFIPVLKDMPKEYIYEPWTAPLSVQEKARCIVGKDYPKPGEKKEALDLLFSGAEST
uniref:Cryptochrome/DNA photolyase FAD-binding domain-containing protein n=1 Tax=Aegilops tauschii subsp. strangulata TaxID=200361 RepID=A0A453NQ68_AEGTS